MLNDCGACTEKTKASKIKVEENGKKAVILNEARSEFLKIKVDGCLIKQDTACDWLVQTAEIGGIFIELKGKDVGHAIDQIEATIGKFWGEDICPKKIAGLIICAGVQRHPSFDSKLQRIRNRLATSFKAPLHIVNGNHEFSLQNVLSFTGPMASKKVDSARANNGDVPVKSISRKKKS